MSQRFPPSAGAPGPPGTPQPRYQQPPNAPGMRPYSGPGSGFPVSQILYICVMRMFDLIFYFFFFVQQQRGFTPPPQMGSGPPPGPPGGMHQRPQQPAFQGGMRGGNQMPSTPTGKRPQDSRQSINPNPQKKYQP